MCFQIPRYIITLHELLAHTPHEHVERNSLHFAKSKLEELSKYKLDLELDVTLPFSKVTTCAVLLCAHAYAIRMMHDEVSDTENIRKNLAIERMIVEGCDILLDTSQTFVRQGGAHASRRLHLPHVPLEIPPVEAQTIVCSPSRQVHSSSYRPVASAGC